jgi:hypothetical protein
MPYPERESRTSMNDERRFEYAGDGIRCGKPAEGTLAAMTHCEHYYDESGPCCWCGSADDEGDHPSCPAVAGDTSDRFAGIKRRHPIDSEWSWPISDDVPWLIAEVERLRDGEAAKPRLWERLYRAELARCEVLQREVDDLMDTANQLQAHIDGCPYNGMEWWLGDES